MVTVTARVDMMARTVGWAMVSEGTTGGGIFAESLRPDWDMDGPHGQELERACRSAFPLCFPYRRAGDHS